LFAGLASPLRVGRYHSLIVDPEDLRPPLRLTAWTEERVPMALAHLEHPTLGVQFHPESILSEQGHQLLANFLRFAGLRVEEHTSGERPALEGEPDFYQQPIERYAVAPRLPRRREP
jgi:GMP synthase-like glutamine amidotransferase